MNQKGTLHKGVDIPAHGASVKGDDIFLDPLAIIPPPAVTGHSRP